MENLIKARILLKNKPSGWLQEKRRQFAPGRIRKRENVYYRDDGGSLLAAGTELLGSNRGRISDSSVVLETV